MTLDVETKVSKSVDEIGRDAIDLLVDDGFFTYGWFKVLEVSKPPIALDPFYVSVYYKGELAAFTPCFRDIADQYFQYGPEMFPFMKRVLNICSRLGIRQNHILLSYSPWCFRTKAFFDKSLNERLLFRKVSEKIDDICSREKILFSSFLFVSEFDQNLKAMLAGLKYNKVLFHKPMLYLDVRWRTFDDYLKSFDCHTRKNIRREIKNCSNNGITIEKIENFKNLANQLSNLSFTVISKYNKWAQKISPRFFECLSDYAKANAIVFVAKKNDNIVGFSLCIRKNETLDAFMVGFNYELQDNSDFTYFNLLYYTPVSWAIHEGLRKIYYRWGSEQAKYSRGCKPEMLYSFVKCQNMLVNSQIKNYLNIKLRIERLFQ